MSTAVQRMTVAAGLFIALCAGGYLALQRPELRSLLSPSPVTAVLTDSKPERPEERQLPLPGNDSSISTEPRRLVLVSIERGRQASDAIARIGTDPRNPQTYRTGSMLANGARIASITADQVVLARDGRTHTLRLNHPAAASSTPPTAGDIDSVGGEPQEITALAESAEGVTNYIRPQPIYDAMGRFVAYELQPGSDPAGLARVDLLPGDQLVAVNGTPLASVDDAAEALQFVSNGGSLEVTLVRSGTTLRTTLDGQRFMAAPPDITGH